MSFVICLSNYGFRPRNLAYTPLVTDKDPSPIGGDGIGRRKPLNRPGFASARKFFDAPMTETLHASIQIILNQDEFSGSVVLNPLKYS